MANPQVCNAMVASRAFASPTASAPWPDLPPSKRLYEVALILYQPCRAMGKHYQAL